MRFVRARLLLGARGGDLRRGGRGAQRGRLDLDDRRVRNTHRFEPRLEGGGFTPRLGELRSVRSRRGAQRDYLAPRRGELAVDVAELDQAQLARVRWRGGGGSCEGSARVAARRMGGEDRGARQTTR